MPHHRIQNRIFLNDLLQIADEGVIGHDFDGKIVFCNPAAERILRLSKDKILGNYCANFASATFREDGSAFPAEAHPATVTLRTGAPCTGVVMGIEWDSETPRSWINISSAIIPPDAENSGMVVAMFTDITPHIEAKHQLREATASLQRKNRSLSMAQSFMIGLLNAIPDRIWVKDTNGAYLFCNAALAKSYNATQLEVVGKTDDDFWPQAQADAFRRTDIEAEQGDKTIKLESQLCVGTLERVVMEAVRVPIRDESGEVLGVLGIARDVTEHIDLQEKLLQKNIALKSLAQEQLLLARTDTLTGLPNRRAFEEAIDPAFQRRARRSAATCLLMIDIDHFKHVNDEFGHEAGDAALVHLADTLRANSRAGDLPVRLGGDEFALLLPNTKPKDALSLAGRLRDEIEGAEISVGKNRFKFSISVGIASFRERDEEWSAAVKRADRALYKAKHSDRH